MRTERSVLLRLNEGIMTSTRAVNSGYIRPSVFSEHFPSETIMIPSDSSSNGDDTDDESSRMSSIQRQGTNSPLSDDTLLSAEAIEASIRNAKQANYPTIGE